MAVIYSLLSLIFSLGVIISPHESYVILPLFLANTLFIIMLTLLCWSSFKDACRGYHEAAYIKSIAGAIIFVVALLSVNFVTVIFLEHMFGFLTVLLPTRIMFMISIIFALMACFELLIGARLERRKHRAATRRMVSTSIMAAFMLIISISGSFAPILTQVSFKSSEPDWLVYIPGKMFQFSDPYNVLICISPGIFNTNISAFSYKGSLLWDTNIVGVVTDSELYGSSLFMVTDSGKVIKLRLIDGETYIIATLMNRRLMKIAILNSTLMCFTSLSCIAGKFYYSAIMLRNSQIYWEIELPYYPSFIHICNKYVSVASRDNVNVITLDGSPIMRMNLGHEIRFCLSMPQLLITLSYDGMLEAYKIPEGNKLWARSIVEDVLDVRILDNSILILTSSHVMQLDANGELICKTRLLYSPINPLGGAFSQTREHVLLWGKECKLTLYKTHIIGSTLSSRVVTGFSVLAVALTGIFAIKAQGGFEVIYSIVRKSSSIR